MPLNELEVHPYLDYYLDLNRPNNYFEGLIIGTFPIYAITRTLFNNDIRFEDNAALQFFYGSRDSKFWNTICKIFEIQNEEHPLRTDAELRVQFAKKVLTDNRLLITDVIKITNRYNSKTKNDFCSLDSSLLNKNAIQEIKQNFSLNQQIHALLNEHRTIKYLYFTATGENGKTPFGLFKKIFRGSLSVVQRHVVGERLFAVELVINNRRFTAFMLPSPAGNGYRGLHNGEQHQTLMFINYINRIENINRQQNGLTALRDDFFLECWKQAFINHNRGFQGS